MGLLFVLAAVVFIAAVAMAAGLFGYGMYLQKDLDQKRERLQNAQSDLQPAFVQEIRRLDARLRHSETILQNHLALSPVFSLLEKSTLSSVQYINFSYLFSPEGVVTLVLSGVAPSFGALALQSDVLYRDKTFTKVEFESVNLDTFGNVIFDLNLDVDQKVVGYRNMIMASTKKLESELPVVATTTTATSTSAGASTSTTSKP